jgi:peroxiredoxin Q/BCP
MLKIGDKAPDFTAVADSGEKVSLKALRGKTVVLYFYPKDDTPGCTKEACGFRDSLKKFERKNVVILGISVDSVASHQKFKKKYSLPFTLLSDDSKSIVAAYGVWKERSLYGRKYLGTERTTFVIDEQGRIQHIFAKVKVDGHIEEILKEVG